MNATILRSTTRPHLARFSVTTPFEWIPTRESFGALAQICLAYREERAVEVWYLARTCADAMWITRMTCADAFVFTAVVVLPELPCI